MSEFKVIETQEQLNEVIGERIRRAEEKAAEKYSDYDALKSKNEEYATQLGDLQKQLQEQAEKIEGHNAEVDALNAKVQAYESSSLKTRIALESGLPYKMAERLTGDDEAAIKKDAEMMVKLMGAHNTVPLGSPEGNITKEASTREIFKEWMQQNNE